MSMFPKCVCRECGSDEVVVTAWVNVNTRIFWDYDNERESYWCPNCGALVDIVSKDSYNENLFRIE